MFATYRSRLMAYTVLLVLFLMATLGYTYVYSRKVILEESENSITNTAQMLNGNLEMEEMELQHYTEIVKDDLRIKEYVFMVSMVGTDDEPLRTLYDRQFGWLPVERRLIMTNDGRVLLGTENADLAKALSEHLETSTDHIFYLQGKAGTEMVTWAPIAYQGKQLGIIAHTHILNKAWLEQHRQYSGGYLFLEHNKVIQLSSLPNAEGKPFRVNAYSHASINGEVYRIRPVMLAGHSSNAPHLWYGVSERKLLAKLEHQSSIMLLLTLGGCIAVLWMGMMIIRNFNKPLTELMHITQDVAQGNLPVMSKSTAKNEIALLSNQFAEMLTALRENQEEIDKVHRELEESAITDSLTKLHNRRYLQDIYPRILAQAQRESHYLTGIMMDIDHFKQINDRLGHLGGDECLKHFANLLQGISRTNDFVFRIGGEEFLILSLDENIEGGKVHGEKIRATLEQNPVRLNDTLIPMTTSIGVSQTDLSLPAGQSLTHLLFHADKALYQAKSAGRNQVRVYITADKYSRAVWDYVS